MKTNKKERYFFGRKMLAICLIDLNKKVPDRENNNSNLYLGG